MTESERALAGRIHALREHSAYDHIVAAVGALHVPGVRSYLEAPATIPDSAVEQPLVTTYEAYTE